MSTSNKSIESWLVVLQLLLGMALSIVFFKATLFGDHFLEDDYLIWFIKFFGVLSLLFFFAVFLVGIIGAIKLKRSNRIPRAVLYSLIFWAISLAVSIVLVSIFSFLCLYIILIGMIVGFNMGMRKNT